MSNLRRVTRRAGLRTVVAAVVAVPLFSIVSAAALKGGFHRLEVMTFNLRFAGTKEPNSWTARRPVMRELLRREAPALIGTQEGLYRQLRDIDSDLGPHYDWIGTGRAGGSRDEFAAVFYDTRLLAPVEYDHFWLSDTPEVIGSNTWGGNNIRMATWVRFRELRDGQREFYVLNTHLDSGSRNARARSVPLLAARIAALDPALPLLVTGDFNVPAHRSSVYDAMLDIGLVDTWDTATERGPLFATFHGYQPLVPDGRRIDWILATPGVTVHRARVNTFSRYGQFPSDHLPVQVTLSLG